MALSDQPGVLRMCRRCDYVGYETSKVCQACKPDLGVNSWRTPVRLDVFPVPMDVMVAAHLAGTDAVRTLACEALGLSVEDAWMYDARVERVQDLVCELAEPEQPDSTLMSMLSLKL